MAVETTPPAVQDFSFGRTQVSRSRRELIHHGKIVPLPERPFDLLLALVDARGSTVSKDRMMALLWPGRVVEENTIEAQVSVLRRALGEDRAWIRTISGNGYQFTGDVTDDRSAIVNPHHSSSPMIGLPAVMSELIGRNPVLLEIVDLAKSHRLITLVGVGGVGKTRLAIEAARSLAARFSDGVCLVDLAPTKSPEFLPMTIARALGFPPGEGTPSLERISPVLQDRQILILFDNCEHIVDCAARMVETILRSIPDAVVIATSREALRLPGECIYRVPSLDVPLDDDAYEIEDYGATLLFKERTGSQSFHHADPRDVRSIIARICRQLDGIPLAIELAAAYVAVLGIEGLASRLDSRFQLLTRGSRVASPRQQTMRATLDWSYDLLSIHEQTALQRLSIFAGPFSIESAQSVASTDDMSPGAVRDCVVSLIDKSLITLDVKAFQVRYRLLETTRAYAREKLQAGGARLVLASRHAQFFLHIFANAQQRAESREELDWNGQYAPHLEDFRSAVRWAFSPEGDSQLGVELALAGVSFSMQLSLLEECLSWVNMALEWLDERAIVADGYRMKLYAARGACLLHQKGTLETDDAFRAALRLAERVGDFEYQMRGVWGRWCYAYLNGLYAEALAFARRFATLAASCTFPSERLVAYRIIGISELCLGNLEDARANLQLALAERGEFTRAQRLRFVYDERALANGSLSHALWFHGFPDQAMQAAEQALNDAAEVSHPPSRCFALSQAVCTIALLNGDRSRLQEGTDALVRTTRRHGFSTWNARGQLWEAFLKIQAGDVEVYDDVVKPALARIGSGQYFVALTPFLSAVGTLLASAGRPSDGVDLIASARERARVRGDECSLSELMRVHGELVLAQNLPQAEVESESLFKEAMALAHRRGFLSFELRCAISLSKLLVRRGDRLAAHALVSGVLSRFTEGRTTEDLIVAQSLVNSI
jgi:predicted ATPase/DNA-binding winged helix-turn-helix (wHTH) protein